MRCPAYFLAVLALAFGCRSATSLIGLNRSIESQNSDRGQAAVASTASAEPGAIVQAKSLDGMTQGSVQLGSFETLAPDGAIPAGTEIVATVNGAPIFAADILDRYAPQLKLARRQLSPAKFEEFRKSLIERDLKDHIRRQLLVDALRSSLKKDQADQLDAQLDKYFEREIERLKKQTKSSSRAELDEKLQQQGTSLANLRDQFANQQLAMEYLRSKATPSKQFSRQDLLDYYHEHIEDFAIPARARWQQIRISYSKHGGKNRTFEVLEQAIAELRRGENFDVVARRYSDGPTAEDGGFWDWTQPGSLANTEIENTLFQLPVGEISQVFSDENGYQLVRTIQREEANARSFEDVQEDIKKKLEQETLRQARQQAIDSLYRKASLESKYNIGNVRG